MEKRNPGNLKPRHFKTRPKESKDMLFGTRPILEAMKAGKEIERILVQREIGNPLITEMLKAAAEHNVPVVKVPLDKLNQLTQKNHQGAICFISAIRYSKLDDIMHQVYDKGEMPFLLLLDRITDVRNFGAISRTAECAGMHAIVIPEKGAAQVNSDAVKTSAGALNFIPVCRERSLGETIKYLQDYGVQVIACTEKASDDIYRADLKGPVALLMGSEEDGIDSELLKKADALYKIPTTGQIASLNVSVAASVIVFETVRQRLAAQ